MVFAVSKTSEEWAAEEREKERKSERGKEQSTAKPERNEMDIQISFSFDLNE